MPEVESPLSVFENSLIYSTFLEGTRFKKKY